MQDWLNVVSWIGVAMGVISALAIAIDILVGNRQHMWIMNLVWPLTALYSGPVGVWAYYRVGRAMTETALRAAKASGAKLPSHDRPLAPAAALAATHCGAGCCLGDVVAESIAVVAPITLFGAAIFGTWALDYVAAFVFGIGFQYYTIKPMRQLSARDALIAALKADTASLTAWQVGMYGWMAIATFIIFGHELDKATPIFWFMMQIAMLAGFLTSWPINAWLLTKGWKERM